MSYRNGLSITALLAPPYTSPPASGGSPSGFSAVDAAREIIASPWAQTVRAKFNSVFAVSLSKTTAQTERLSESLLGNFALRCTTRWFSMNSCKGTSGHYGLSHSYISRRFSGGDVLSRFQV